MKHRIFLNLTIDNFEDITHDEISRKLEMIPYRIYIKGQKRNPAFTADEPVWQMNRWIMASPLNEYSSFIDQMNSTLDIIEPKIDLFKPICEKYTCEFACAVYLALDSGESYPSIYLDSRYNRLIKELNILKIK